MADFSYFFSCNFNAPIGQIAQQVAHREHFSWSTDNSMTRINASHGQTLMHVPHRSHTFVSIISGMTSLRKFIGFTPKLSVFSYGAAY